MMDISHASKGDRFECRNGQIVYFMADTGILDGDFLLRNEKTHLQGVWYKNGRQFRTEDFESDSDIVKAL
jgi:hypothetical protein